MTRVAVRRFLLATAVYQAFVAVREPCEQPAFAPVSVSRCGRFGCRRHGHGVHGIGSRIALLNFAQFREKIDSGETFRAQQDEHELEREINESLRRLLGPLPAAKDFAGKLRRATDNTTYGRGLQDQAMCKIRQACKSVLGHCNIRIYGSQLKGTCSSPGQSDLDLDVQRSNTPPKAGIDVTDQEKNQIKEELRKIPWVRGPDGSGEPVVTEEVAIKFSAVEDGKVLNIDLVAKPQPKIRQEGFARMLGCADRKANEMFLMHCFNGKPAFPALHAIRALKLLLPRDRPPGAQGWE
ncbi:unnamed protein product [Effrenium voratum]|nr:unnamed protein product [Effrenium voratum]